MTASQLLQTLIRVLHAGNTCDSLSAHHHLDRLSQNLPVRIQISGNNLGRNIQTLKALHHIGDSQHRVTKRHTNIALRRGVSQVTLPTRSHQGRTQRIQQSVRELQVSLRILKANRVHLVRHSRRTGRTSHRNLTEETNRNVAPHIGAEVVQHTVEVRDIRVQLGLPVVRLNLGGQRVPGQAQVLHKTTRNSLPISVRNRRIVSSVSAGRTINLAEELGSSSVLHLTLQTVGENTQLLTQGGGSCRLTVSAAQHRHVAAFLSQLQQNLNQVLSSRNPHVLNSVLDAQRVGEVVNVLGGAAEVNQRHQVTQAQALQAATNVVLNRLHVVNGDCLNLSQLRHRISVEIGHDGAQALLLLLAQRGQTRQHLVLAQVNEPLNLNVDAVAVQSRLRKVVGQGRGHGCVASVEGAQRKFAGAQVNTARRQEGVIGVRHNSIFA